MTVRPEPALGPAAQAGLGRRLVANTLHAASGRLAALLVWLIFTPAILRDLGPSGFGVWALFFALTGYFSTLDFGLVQGTLRHVAAARGRGTHDQAGAFATLGLLGYLALGTLWLALTAAAQGSILRWLRIPLDLVPGARFAMYAGAVVFVVCGFASLMMAVAQGFGRFDLANRILLAVTAAQGLGFAIVLWRGWGLEGLVLSVGAGWLLGSAFGAVVLRRGLQEFRWQRPRDSLPHLAELFRFGGPMQLTNALAVVHLHFDKALLSRFVALAAVAPYELGSRVATAASTLPQLILLAVLPEAAAIHAAGDHARLRELYDRGSRYALAAVAVVLAPLLGCGDRLYQTWLGSGHSDAAFALRALTITVGISLATGMGTTVARSIARTDLEAWFALLTLSIHVGLSLWLVPRLGLPGALAATLVGTLAGALLFLALLGRALAWPLWRVVLRPFARPVLAVAIGTAAGVALDRIVPASPGPLGWGELALTAAGAGLAAFAAILASGYLRWPEIRSLFARSA